MADKVKTEEERIDELIERIDLFMEKGGGRMNVTGGEGEPEVKSCPTCCGESTDQCFTMPVKID